MGQKNEQLQEIFESEVLNEETKEQLASAISTKLEEKEAEILERVDKEKTVEYATRFNEEKASLIEKVYRIISEKASEEFNELKEDIDYYKDLETKYANKLQDFKESYKDEMAKLIRERVKTIAEQEFDELKEDIQEVKKEDFGRKIFEAYKPLFEQYGFAPEERDVRDELRQTKTKLAEKTEEAEKLLREKKISELTESLTGTKKEVMTTILESVPTRRLEKRYDEVIDSLINEDHGNKTSLEEDTKESETLLESGKTVPQGVHVEDDPKTGEERVYAIDEKRLSRLIGRK